MSNQASSRDWKSLLKSVANLVLLIDLCAGHLRCVDNDGLFGLVPPIVHFLASWPQGREIRAIAAHLENTFDVEGSEEQGKFVVKAGVDEELDQKRRLHNGLPDLLLKVMEEEEGTEGTEGAKGVDGVEGEKE